MPKIRADTEVLAAAKKARMSVGVIRKRMRSGMSLEQALNTRYHRATNSTLAAAIKERLSAAVLRHRMAKGMTLEQAIQTGAKHHANDPMWVSEIARAAGLKPRIVLRRLQHGWSLETALNTPVRHRGPNKPKP